MSKYAFMFIVVFHFVVFLLLSFVYCKHALHMFQQNRYELYRYSKWLFNKNNIKVYPGLIYAIIVLTLCTLSKRYGDILTLLVTIAFTIYLFYRENNKTYIKDLVLTTRVKRQIVVMSILMLLLMHFTMNLFRTDIIGILCIIMPYLFIYLVAVITEPIEYLIKKYYENQARSILNSMNYLLKIGITGSYGKTSTKNIVNDIISEEKFTLITPASYNTPMGITRTIREMLKPIHEVFVCEMGADKIGDISYLMDFVKPQYGVVTSIGPQHLNTFKLIDNIVNEKMQEIEMLPSDGVGFINIDNEYIKKYKIKNKCKIVTVGIENKKADYSAKDIVYSKNGSKFTVNINGKDYKFTTDLLGQHNITNILIGIAIALQMNVDIKKIVKNVKNVRQVEHRLQVKKINDYTFIDDAFNSNPVGSKMAVDVLSMMPGKRVIVTPGMIDLGEKQDKINKDFGKYMLDKLDYVLLVGEKQSKPIYDGLKEVGFDLSHVLVFDNVKQAFEYVYKNFSTRDTILLENDLPDAFNV